MPEEWNYSRPAGFLWETNHSALRKAPQNQRRIAERETFG
jgi:hypothetical protein